MWLDVQQANRPIMTYLQKKNFNRASFPSCCCCKEICSNLVIGGKYTGLDARAYQANAAKLTALALYRKHWRVSCAMTSCNLSTTRLQTQPRPSCGCMHWCFETKPTYSQRVMRRQTQPSSSMFRLPRSKQMTPTSGTASAAWYFSFYSKLQDRFEQ